MNTTPAPVVIRIPNFISKNEAKVLSDWVSANESKAIFKRANMGGSRKTTRFSASEVFCYPELSDVIRKRILKTTNLEEREALGIIPPFKNGIVASYAPPGDTCSAHFDPVWVDGYHTLHCNIITQAPDAGGDVLIEGETEQMHECELFCYLVSKHEHEVTEVLGNTARIMWVFGFCMTDSEWEQFCALH